MKLLKIALIAVVALILTPILLMQGFHLYISIQNLQTKASTPRAEPAASPAARDCASMRHNRPSAWDVGDEKYRQFMKDWVETCEREAAADPSAPVQLSWFKALFAADRRPEAIIVLRNLAATGNADALYEIYEWHRSWEREDLDKTQIVNSREASDALRRAAEAGHPRSMHVYACRRALERADAGEPAQRDHACRPQHVDRTSADRVGRPGQASARYPHARIHERQLQGKSLPGGCHSQGRSGARSRPARRHAARLVRHFAAAAR
jgi:hypothetical protein